MTTRRQGLSKQSRLPAVIAAIVVPLLLLFVGWELTNEFRNNREVRSQVDRSYETRSQIQRIFSLLQDAETGQRGYLITGDDRFLQPYQDARRDLGTQMAVLSELFARQPVQRAQFVQLQALAARKLALMEDGIATRRTQGAEAGLAFVAAGQGKAVMDQVRVVIAQMTAFEADELANYSQSAERRTDRTELLVGALFVALLASVAAAAFLIWRYTRSRQEMLEGIRATATRQAAIFDGAIDAHHHPEPQRQHRDGQCRRRTDVRLLRP